MRSVVAITGRGVYLPRRQYTNQMLPALDEPPTPEQLEKIGVERRGWAGPDEGIAEMAAHAARQALERAGLEAEAIELLVLANWTQRRLIPEFAPKVQHLLGASRAWAFDVCGACAGFVSGLAIAQSFLESRRYARALVVASETTSQRARPRSRATLVFGDGAGAWVLERGEGRGSELVGCLLRSDGAQHGAMEIDARGYVKTHLDQRGLNRLAADSFRGACRELLARHGLELREVRWVVPHSGTAGIQALLVKALELPAEKVFSNFSTVGNVSSAAIPVAFEALVGEGRVAPGDLVLSPTTGTGWYLGAALYRYGE